VVFILEEEKYRVFLRAACRRIMSFVPHRHAEGVLKARTANLMLSAWCIKERGIAAVLVSTNDARGHADDR
jgi:hypothetical protein